MRREGETSSAGPVYPWWCQLIHRATHAGVSGSQSNLRPRRRAAKPRPWKKRVRRLSHEEATLNRLTPPPPQNPPFHWGSWSRPPEEEDSHTHSENSVYIQEVQNLFFWQHSLVPLSPHRFGRADHNSIVQYGRNISFERLTDVCDWNTGNRSADVMLSLRTVALLRYRLLSGPRSSGQSPRSPSAPQKSFYWWDIQKQNVTNVRAGNIG